MPKRNQVGIEPGGQIVVDAHPENRERNRSNWLRALVMGAAIGAAITLSGILLFEWYFFTVIDGLAVNLRPVAEALLEVDQNAPMSPANRQREQFAASTPGAPRSSNDTLTVQAGVNSETTAD